MFYESMKTRTLPRVNWDNIDVLKEALGAEELLQELCRAMSAQELKENLEFIATQHDIVLEGMEEEED